MTALLAGWLADEVVGDPRRLHPVAWHGRLAGALECRLRGDGHRDRPDADQDGWRGDHPDAGDAGGWRGDHPGVGDHRGPGDHHGGWRGDRRGAGLAYVATLVALPAVVAGVVQRRLTGSVPGPAGAGAAPQQEVPSPVPGLAVLAAATWLALGGRSLRREASDVATAVADGRLDVARARLPALCGRDPDALDAPGLCRATVESVAENTADAVVAPLLAGALAGLPGVVAYRCANTLDAMVGYRTPGYERFGWAAARLDDALGWLPARVTAALVVLVAPVVGGSPRQAAAVWRRDHRRHPSPNAGVCEAAVAGALGVRLGGENHYGDTVETRGPQGDGPPPTPADVGAAIALSRAVGLAAVVLAAAAAVLIEAAARRDATPAARPRRWRP